MQQTKPSLFSLVTYALSTVASHPVLPRWMQDLSPEEGRERSEHAARAVTPSPPRKRSVSAAEVRITIAPALAQQPVQPAHLQPRWQMTSRMPAQQRQLF